MWYDINILYCGYVYTMYTLFIKGSENKNVPSITHKIRINVICVIESNKYNNIITYHSVLCRSTV